MAQIPLPLDAADRAAGFWWELSMRQVETSRTLVFDDDVHARAFFEALLCENMDLGQHENVELLFRRGQRLGRPTIAPPGGGFKTKIDRYCDLVTLNVFYKNSRLKQYFKDGVALRIEGPSPSSTTPKTCAATGGSPTSPNCSTRHVRSTPGCCTLKPPARTRHL